jgi:hypothetical protein
MQLIHKMTCAPSVSSHHGDPLFVRMALPAERWVVERNERATSLRWFLVCLVYDMPCPEGEVCLGEHHDLSLAWAMGTAVDLLYLAGAQK